jgi:hypothetical protein
MHAAENEDCSTWTVSQSSFSIVKNYSDIPGEQSETNQIENMTCEDGLISGIRCLKFAERYHQRENSSVRQRSSSPPPRKYVKSPHISSRPQSSVDLSDLVLGGVYDDGLTNSCKALNFFDATCSHADLPAVSKKKMSPNTESTSSLSSTGDRIREVNPLLTWGKTVSSAWFQSTLAVA